MKQLLCRMLALILALGMLVPAFAADAVHGQTAEVHAAPAAEPGTSSAGTVALKYLDPSKFVAARDKYKFSEDNEKLETMAEEAKVEDGKLTVLPDAPAVSGWTFEG